MIKPIDSNYAQDVSMVSINEDESEVIRESYSHSVSELMFDQFFNAEDIFDPFEGEISFEEAHSHDDPQQ